ncbi:MAG: hypothetical protein M0R70_04195 [Nitrospirae bacterium]|nr:hypothetical protein [Nitrospirota bacterium]
MKSHTNTFSRCTSSSDLVFSFGLSIVMHAVLLLVDPLGHFNVSDRLKEQQNGIIMVNLKNGVDKGQGKGGRPSRLAVVKKVSQEKGEKKKKKREAGPNNQPLLKRKAPTAIAKPVSPVQKPVHVTKASQVDSAPVSPVPVPVVSSDAPPSGEMATKTKAVLPVPAQKKVREPDQPPIIAPDEPDITVMDNLKPKPDIVKPVDKPHVRPSGDLRKEEIEREDAGEKISTPALQEVKEPIKPEVAPPAPVAAAPTVHEESHATPVKEAPAKAYEQPVASPVQDVQEPIKPESQPFAPVVAAAALPEERDAAPVNEAPAKAEEQPVVSPTHKEALQNIPLSEKTVEVKAEESLPLSVIADPPDVKKEEKEKGGVDQAKDRDLSAKSAPAPVEPAITAEMARGKAAETLRKVVEPKAAALVRKKTISLTLLKRLESGTDPIRIGIPISRPSVKITTPAAKKIKNRVQKIAGQVKGNGITRVILSLNDDSVTVPVERDAFNWEGALKEGKNTIIATVWDRNRYSAVDKIIVEVIPAKNSFSLSIDEPGAGEVESPVITVKGKVGDSTVETVRLILNKGAIEVVAKDDGGFEKTVLFRDGENSLQAEAVNATGASARSGILNVTVKNQKTPDILVHLIWNDPDSELRATVARKNREGLDQENGAVSNIDVAEKMSVREGYRERIFAVYGAKAGAHLISVSGGKKTKCLVIVTIPSKQKTRLFGPVLIGEEGTMIGRLLMPEGVYWDEDEWFTGKIENGDSITKYNSPEGMSWKETK